MTKTTDASKVNEKLIDSTRRKLTKEIDYKIICVVRRILSRYGRTLVLD